MTQRPKRGEIWLVRFPFTDFTSTKLRSVLVWATYGEDAIVLGIFSKFPKRKPQKTWVPIKSEHPGFKLTGLKKASLIKSEKIAVIHISVFQRKLGKLPQDIMLKAQEALKKALLI